MASEISNLSSDSTLGASALHKSSSLSFLTVTDTSTSSIASSAESPRARKTAIMSEITTLQLELMALQEEIDKQISLAKSLPPTPSRSNRNSKVISLCNTTAVEMDATSPLDSHSNVADIPTRGSSLIKDLPTSEVIRKMTGEKPNLNLLNVQIDTTNTNTVQNTTSTSSSSSGISSLPRIRKISTLTKEEQVYLQMINMAKKKFNMSPKLGLQYLMDCNYFSTAEPSAQDIASFLFKENEMLSKTVIGEYLGDGNQFNIKVFNNYVKLHDFKDLVFDEALRRFLKTFRLPGEAQKIDRMMEKFAERYLECNPNNSIITHTDTAYILAFSIIMLNTDLHNPAVKNKIKKATFVRNNLDILCGKDGDENLNKNGETAISSTFLENLYDAMKEKPLEMVNPTDEDPLNNNPFYFTFYNPEREGWLVKQGGRIKTWKRRYCILTGSCLYYFKNEASRDFQDSETKQQPCGIIPLENLQVESLDIIDGSTSKKKFFFRLHVSEEEMMQQQQHLQLESPISPTEPLKSPSSLFFKKFKTTIKAAKTKSDGKIVEGRHSDYLFLCDSEGERTDWVQSISGQMAKPPIYSLYEKRKNKISSVNSSSANVDIEIEEPLSPIQDDSED